MAVAKAIVGICARAIMGICGDDNDNDNGNGNDGNSKMTRMTTSTLAATKTSHVTINHMMTIRDERR